MKIENTFLSGGLFSGAILMVIILFTFNNFSIAEFIIIYLLLIINLSLGIYYINER
jgi:hypothetical protein